MTPSEYADARSRQGNGFIAALDQSGGSTPKALTAMAIAATHGRTTRRCSTSSTRCARGSSPRRRSAAARSSARSCSSGPWTAQVDGKPVPQALIDQGVVPFIKIDKGLEDEANGVQLMKPMPELDALLTRARALGVFGTKERSVINLANPEGIAAVGRPAVRGGAQGAGARHGADHRAGGQHQEPGAGRGRPHPARRNPQGARFGAGERAGDAQADDPGRGGTVRAAGRPSQGASRRRACPAGSAATRPASSWRATRA